MESKRITEILYFFIILFFIWAPTSGICQEVQPSDSITFITQHDSVIMNDGVRLATDIYLPLTGGPFPVILVRTPYDKKNLEKAVSRFTSDNYALVTQDVRGKFLSEGKFYPFINERRDGLTTVEWVRRQPWCNGKVGGFGGSYVGITQWAISDVLDAITPELTSADIYGLVYPGGIFSLATAFNWGLLVDAKTMNPVKPDKILSSYTILPLSVADDSTTKDIIYIDEWLAHETYDSYWQEQNFRDDARAPVFSIAGWYDIFLMPQIIDFQVLNENLRAKSRLIIGPWCHGKQAWDYNYGGREKKGDKKDWMEGFFAEYLKDQPFDYNDPVFKNKTYNLFVMMRNEYYGCNTWPPESVELTPYYLGPDGSLSPQMPKQGGRLSYLYDPADPFPNRGGTFLGLNVGAAVQNDNSSRKDQLIFETAPLSEELILLGPLSASLYVSSDAPSTDFYVSLHDVMPNDTIINIQEGGGKVSVTSGINKVDLSVWATGYQLNPGHKLRVVITSALFPRFNRNLNLGEPIYSARKMKVANQSLYYGDHPSSVILPVLKLKDPVVFEE